MIFHSYVKLPEGNIEQNDSLLVPVEMIRWFDVLSTQVPKDDEPMKHHETVGYPTLVYTPVRMYVHS